MLHFPLMQITVNGEQKNVAENSTIMQLLEALSLAGKPVVIEMNLVAILPREHASTIIPDAANLEIITLAAGG